MERGKEVSDKVLIVLLIISIFISVIGTLAVYFHVNSIEYGVGEVINNFEYPKSNVGQIGVVVNGNQSAQR